jgi:FAD/FMN-containing dehydrogenase
MLNDVGLPITNWCGTHVLARAHETVRPTSEEQVRQLLSATTVPDRVQMLGNRYSWPQLIDGHDGFAMDLTGLNEIHSMDADSIEVGAGATLAELHTVLRRAGRRLGYSPPVIASQTLGGAVATGTHGQGLGQSTLGDIVESIRVIDAAGRTSEITAEDPRLGAYRLHLGCLGAITRMRLRTVPNTVYTCEKLAMPHDQFAREFIALNHQYTFCKAWWFPGHDQVHLWLVRPADAQESAAFAAGDGSLVEWGDRNTAMNHAVDDTIDQMRTDTKSEDLTHKQFQTVLRFRDFTDVTGDLTDILCKGIPVAQINCEIGVPLSAVPRVQRELADWYQERQPNLHYPIIMRPTGPSDAWLSPAYQRDTCYYGLVIYQAEDGSFTDQAFEHLHEVQDILAAAGGMPHWGKYFTPERFDFTRYPKWQEFDELRRNCDPQSRFVGAFLNRVLKQS